MAQTIKHKHITYKLELEYGPNYKSVNTNTIHVIFNRSIKNKTLTDS